MKRTLTTPQKLAATATVLATAGALTAGAFAAWNTTASQHQDLGTATVSSAFTNERGEEWQDEDFTNVIPSAVKSRLAALTNTGSVTQIFVVDVKGTNGQLTAAEDGMKVDIRSCATKWLPSCNGQTADLASGFITDDGVTSEQVVLAPDETIYLQIQFWLPEDASPSFQGQLDKFVVTATGTPSGGDQYVQSDYWFVNP